MSNFPEWFTIDDDGLDSLIHYLIEEFKGKTIKIIIEEERK